MTMISRGVEISIAGGVEETKDRLSTVTSFFLFFIFFLFFLWFFNHMRLFKVQRQPSSVSSTHPVTEISTPGDYHHYTQLPPRHGFVLGGSDIPPLLSPSLRFIPLVILYSELMDFVFF